MSWIAKHQVQGSSKQAIKVDLERESILTPFSNTQHFPLNTPWRIQPRFFLWRKLQSCLILCHGANCQPTSRSVSSHRSLKVQILITNRVFLICQRYSVQTHSRHTSRGTDPKCLEITLRHTQKSRPGAQYVFNSSLFQILLDDFHLNHKGGQAR